MHYPYEKKLNLNSISYLFIYLILFDEMSAHRSVIMAAMQNIYSAIK